MTIPPFPAAQCPICEATWLTVSLEHAWPSEFDVRFIPSEHAEFQAWSCNHCSYICTTHQTLTPNHPFILEAKALRKSDPWNN